MSKFRVTYKHRDIEAVELMEIEEYNRGIKQTCGIECMQIRNENEQRNSNVST